MFCPTRTKSVVCRLAMLLFLALGPACSGACAGLASGSPGPMRPYEEGHEVRRYTAVTLPHVELWQATPTHQCCDQESSIVVVGIDREGRVVPAIELVHRLAPRSAEDWVRPVSDILLHRPWAAIRPGDTFLASSFVTAPEAALVAAPTLEGSTLTFYVVAGSMAPALLRLTVDLTSGEVRRDFTRSLVGPPPEDPIVVLRRQLASGEPVAVRAALGAIDVDRARQLVPELLAVAGSGLESELRQRALAHLRNNADPSTIAPLGVILTHDADADVRLAAVYVLAAIRTPEAIAIVREFAATRSVAEAQRIYTILQQAGAQ